MKAIHFRIALGCLSSLTAAEASALQLACAGDMEGFRDEATVSLNEDTREVTIRAREWTMEATAAVHHNLVSGMRTYVIGSTALGATIEVNPARRLYRLNSTVIMRCVPTY